MAEFNLFMGTARKSVGDITLMRRAGRQLARVRLRTISNPKTEAQAIQRNFVAPVARFYGPLKHVLKRSWEGYNTDNSYNKFLSVNVDLARREQWFLPKGAPWKPLPYQLSAGSLTPLKYEMFDDGSYTVLVFDSDYYVTSITKISQLSDIFIHAGYQPGDVVTFIYVVDTADGVYNPISFQFVVNTSDQRLITSIAGSDFRVENDDGTIICRAYNQSMLAAAIVIARKFKGQWLRSTQFMVCEERYLSTLVSQEAREASIASYQAPDSDDSGGVYPGGDDNLFNVATSSGRALLFIGGQFTAQVVTVNSNKVIQLKADNYDQYYYVLNDLQYPLGTNSAGSLTPSDWHMLSIFLPASSYTEYIPLSEGSQMYLYLQSIGWTGS